MNANEAERLSRPAQVEIETRVLGWVDHAFPGFLEVELLDAQCRRHLIHEKVPVLFAELLSPSDTLPESCWIQCKILEERDLFFVVEPLWGIESIDGLSRFEIARDRIRECRVNRQV